MKKTLKTNKVLSVYRILSQAKYTKLDDADKIKVWKVARILSPIAEKFDADMKDAAEKMKPYEKFDEALQKAQEYEQKVKEANVDVSTLPMTAKEYTKFIAELRSYNELVGNASKEFGEVDVDLDIEPVSEDAFGKLLASNDWSMGQVVEVGDLIVE